MRPETLENDAPEGPKWLQNDSKMAPWRLPGGPGVPRLILIVFGSILDTIFARKSLKTVEKRGVVLNDIFGPLEDFWDSFGVDFGVIFGCFLAARPRSGQNRENHEK